MPAHTANKTSSHASAGSIWRTKGETPLHSPYFSPRPRSRCGSNSRPLRRSNTLCCRAPLADAITITCNRKTSASSVTGLVLQKSRIRCALRAVGSHTARSLRSLAFPALGGKCLPEREREKVIRPLTFEETSRFLRAADPARPRAIRHTAQQRAAQLPRPSLSHTTPPYAAMRAPLRPPHRRERYFRSSSHRYGCRHHKQSSRQPRGVGTAARSRVSVPQRRHFRRLMSR